MNRIKDEESKNLPTFPGSSSVPVSVKHSKSWRIWHINLKFVLASQQWATIILTILVCCVPVAILHWGSGKHPRVRDIFLYDATISYPEHENSVPAWAAWAIPLILLILTVLVGEFVLYRPLHANITNAVTTSLHFIIDSLAAFIVAILVYVATKSAVGYPRPDYLARCKPAGGENYQFHTQYGTMSGVECTETNIALVDDGRSSFPSGHACMSAVFVWYTAGYFLWAIYFRHRQSVFGRFVERTNWLGFFIKDLGHALALYWILLNVGLSWAIAGSRVVNNKHHPADVVGGFFLGASVALIFVIRATACLKFIPVYNIETDGAEHLRGGEHGVGDNRLEMAELGDASLNGAPPGSSPRRLGTAQSLGAHHSIPLN
ncbi:probable phospholipid phosphatase 1 [Coccomyxa sp. Obi]|nr:probable phospholipid phosphatase 1 [Coccomyxa sp. Obi]